MVSKKIAKTILNTLRLKYPKRRPTLNYESAIQLLVATILAAQCTDKRVNKITKKLFLKYKTVKDYSKADLDEFELEIKSSGFYKNKAKNIISAARDIKNKFNSKVPDTMNELLTLSGIGRKTANIILAHIYKKNEGIAVDTHVKRLSFRIGLTTNKTPEKIEKDLMKIYEIKEWKTINSVLVRHGRTACKARNPICNKCIINQYCKYKLKGT